MKLDSKECNEVLLKYPVKNDVEKMAVKVLTTKNEDVYLIPGMIEMSDSELDELVIAINEIRDIIGIKG